VFGAAASPEKMVETVARVSETHYDREEMRKHAFGKLGGGDVERFLSWRR
jgi:hypothetical protein